MALRIVDGQPGSGKTYYIVKHLADNYFEKQKDGRYELVKPCTLICNIDEFTPEHFKLSDCIMDAGGVNEFFSNEYQEEFRRRFDSPIVYIIDEAQRLFRKSDRTLPSDLFFYFEYHRHYGQDIYMATQNIKKLHPDISVLTEYLITAAPRSRSVLGNFKYNWISDGLKINTESFRPDPGVFALYKSMDSKESEKVGSPMARRSLLFAGVFFAIFLVSGYYTARHFHMFGTPDPKTVSSSSPPISTTSVVTSSSVAGVKVPSSSVSSLVKIKVSSITTFFGSSEKTFLVFQDALYKSEDFPYPLSVALGSYWAMVPAEILKTNFQEERSGASTGAAADGAAKRADL